MTRTFCRLFSPYPARLKIRDPELFKTPELSPHTLTLGQRPELVNIYYFLDREPRRAGGVTLGNFMKCL